MAVLLTSLGIVSTLGLGKTQTWENFSSGGEEFLNRTDKYSPGEMLPLGEVNVDLPELPARLKKYQSRNNQMLLLVLSQIEDALNMAKRHYEPDRIGVVIGTSTSGIGTGELAFTQFKRDGHWPKDYHYNQQDLFSPSQFASDYFDLKGPVYTISTACSSGAKALGSAKRLIEMGLCDLVIAGGVDSLCGLTVQGFGALDAISAERCNPFSLNRKGINIGEGAAIFLLEAASDQCPAATNNSGRTADSSNKRVIRLAGVGESSDAHHISAPDPEGTGAYIAMENALKSAEVGVNDIDYINLHGTATKQNDAMESKAVSELFSHQVPCSSTKPLTGHCLGAAGAIEAGLCYLMLDSEDDSRLPAQIWDKQTDDTLSRINLIDQVSPRICDLNRIMSNSFAFGGGNISIILERS